MTMTIHRTDSEYPENYSESLRNAAIDGFLEGFCGFGFLDFSRRDDTIETIKIKIVRDDQEKSGTTNS